MAKSLPKSLEEELTCHICTEVYTDPVQLPCQHSFCRECLRAYVSADTTPDVKKNNRTSVDEPAEQEVLAAGDVVTSVTPTVSDKTVGCPICEKVLQLSSEGVSELPLHFTIANIVEKYWTETKKQDDEVSEFRNDDVGSKADDVEPKDDNAGPKEDSIGPNNDDVRPKDDNVGPKEDGAEPNNVLPNCSLCEDDEPKTAVKGCGTCKTLYCQECLNVCHPMRGSLSKHTLFDADLYVQNIDISACQEHDAPLEVFCVDCKQLCCLRCNVKNHAKHDVKLADDALEKEKERLEIRRIQIKKSYRVVRSCVTELSKRKSDVLKCFDDDSETVKMKYQKILAAQDEWMSLSMDDINGKRISLVKRLQEDIDAFQLQLSEVDTFLKDKQEYFESCRAISYLMDSEETFQGLTKWISDMDSSVKSYKSNKPKMTKGLNDQPSPKTAISLTLGKVPRNAKNLYKFEECAVSCPDFSLKETVCVWDDNVRSLRAAQHKISDGYLRGSFADHSFHAGRVYWEVDISCAVTWTTRSSGLVSMYGAGVVHQSKVALFFPSHHSWGVILEQDDSGDNTFVCMCKNLRVAVSNVSPDFQTKFQPPCSVRQGFYLDCPGQTLTILDCTHDRVLHTFTDLDLSEPLTPAVGVYDLNYKDVSIRLRTGKDIPSLPKSLCEMLKGS